MPQHKAQWKSIRRSERQRTRNRQVRAEVRTAIKDLRESELTQKPELLRAATSEIDVAVRKGIIKKSTANRRKSRLARACNREGGKPEKKG
jgi:small subunit ribosomal protein S20